MENASFWIFYDKGNWGVVEDEFRIQIFQLFWFSGVLFNLNRFLCQDIGTHLSLGTFLLYVQLCTAGCDSWLTLSGTDQPLINIVIATSALHP